MTYRERLSKATAKAKRANPNMTWRDAKETGKAYLHNILHVYPSDKMLMLQFKKWQAEKDAKDANA